MRYIFRLTFEDVPILFLPLTFLEESLVDLCLGNLLDYSNLIYIIFYQD